MSRSAADCRLCSHPEPRGGMPAAAGNGAQSRWPGWAIRPGREPGHSRPPYRCRQHRGQSTVGCSSSIDRAGRPGGAAARADITSRAPKECLTRGSRAWVSSSANWASDPTPRASTRPARSFIFQIVLIHSRFRGSKSPKPLAERGSAAQPSTVVLTIPLTAAGAPA